MIGFSQHFDDKREGQVQLCVCKRVVTFFKNCIYLLTYFWLQWVFVAAQGLSVVVARWNYFLVAVCGLLIVWLFLLQSMGSSVPAQ